MTTLFDTIDSATHPELFDILRRQLVLTPKHEPFLGRRFRAATADELGACETVAREIALLAGAELDTVLRDYDFICQAQVEEEYHFRRTGEYRLKTLQEAIDQVYSNGPYMASYMNGLLITQLYWSNHTACFRFYRDRYLPSLPNGYDFLEIGPGHGLLLHQAASDPRSGTITGWDLSETSIAQTRAALARLGSAAKVTLTEQSLFAPDGHRARFDGIVFSEVLEHMEEPDRALRQLHALLKPGGRLFVNVPINSPAPDHLYLLRSPEEAVAAVEGAGFTVDDSAFFPATNYTLEQARRRALTISVCVAARRA